MIWLLINYLVAEVRDLSIFALTEESASTSKAEYTLRFGQCELAFPISVSFKSRQYHFFFVMINARGSEWHFGFI